MSHTPGPWKVIKPQYGTTGRHKFRCVQIGKCESYTTLEMLPGDAKLMAAAPDLLEACEALLVEIASVRPHVQVKDIEGCFSQQIISQAEIAIAKAK